jgi:UDP-3-O-[3-hydroxymyristoyl] glucosamine N-acyltransferase
MTLQEIAAWLDGDLIGDGTVRIDRVAKIEEADQHAISFLANPKYERFLETTNASAVFVSKSSDSSKLPRRPNLTYIKVADPYIAFLLVLKKLTPAIDPFPSGIHPTAFVAATATVGNSVTLGAYVVVGEGASIGDRTKLSHGCVVGVNAHIGSDCLFYPNVTVYHECRIGDRVVLHSGSVIGSDGFGFAKTKNGAYEKIPQLGIVHIEDDVEIGSNTTIDRATIGETRIDRGVKIDNLVQIGHNCTIGENTVIAAQTGISGSVKIGKNCVLAGQVGIAGHLEIADGVTILAQSGITKTIDEPGTVMFGYPAKEQHRAHRVEAVVRNLPELSRDVSQLQREFEALRKSITQNKS